MEIEILQENLSKALSTAARFVSSRATLPVLANILLKANKTRLILQATNLESSVSTSIGAKVETEGSITVPARFLADMVANLPRGTVQLTAKQEQLLVTTENFSGNVAGMNPADFPTVPDVLGSSPICMSADNFLAASAQTLFAVSTDESRPVLTGVLLSLEKNNLVMVGTDGHRLSQKSVAIEYQGDPKKVILPKNAVAEVGRLVGSGETVCMDLATADNNALFGMEQTVLTSRIIEGEFPNFERIIPKDKNITVRINREDFLRGIKLAEVFSKDSGYVGRLTLSEGKLEISSESPRSGNQKTSVEASVEGGKLEITYNLHFIEEFLQAVHGEEITIEFTDSASAGVFRISGDSSFLHLIMPVKLQG